MPELPEVEILVKHLAGVLPGRRIHQVTVHKAGVIRPDRPGPFRTRLSGAAISGVRRRGKYLVFGIRRPEESAERTLVGHLGMTGRLYVQTCDAPLRRHVVIDWDLGPERWVFEDPRRFGRFSLHSEILDGLGPEPMDDGFSAALLHGVLGASRGPVKVRLMDQRVVAGLGNIYACESLFVAGIDPRRRCADLRPVEVERLQTAIRGVLGAAIRLGSAMPLNLSGAPATDRLFYFGRSDGSRALLEERFWVYDREGAPCRRCGGSVLRLAQSGRSTFYCARCQR